MTKNEIMNIGNVIFATIISPKYGIKFLVCNEEETDLELLRMYRWRVKKNGNTFYAMTHIWIDGKQTTKMFHQLKTGRDDVDHIDRDGMNNLSSNLDLFATRTTQCLNRKKKNTNTSGETGISWFQRDEKWRVQVSIDGKNNHYGYFEDFNEAIEKRNQIREERNEYYKTLRDFRKLLL